jgi:putative phosphoribosyl transferase
VTAIAHDRPIDLGVEIHVPGAVIEGDWSVPLHPRGVIILASGTGNSRLSRRNRQVARQLYDAGFATLLLDLLTLDEERENSLTGVFRLDIPLFSERLLAASHWIEETEVGHLPLCYLAAGVASAAAIVASVREPGLVSAIVSRDGRPDLAGIELHRALAPTLLIVGSTDVGTFELNRWALRRLCGEAKLAVVPGASHAFEEPKSLEEVCRLAIRWFEGHLSPRAWLGMAKPGFSVPWMAGQEIGR